jgi:hypothetical protein
LTDDHTRRARHHPPPTPEEDAAVCAFARAHPLIGYKRLAWDMVDRDIASATGPRLSSAPGGNLLARRPPLALKMKIAVMNGLFAEV